MATWYVSADRGDDSSGAGTAASPYKTISKAIGSSGVASAGDAVYVEPGIYREIVAIGVQGSSGSPITVVGDGDGAGFEAGGYSTPKLGTVEIAAWTDDATPFETTSALMPIVNKSYFLLRGFKFVAGGGTGNYSCFEFFNGSSNWTFEDCIFLGSPQKLYVGRLDSSTATSIATTFRRCDFVSVVGGSWYGVDLRSPLNATEYSLGVLFESCNFIGGNGGVWLHHFGSGSAWSTGVTFQQCGFWFGDSGIFATSTTTLTTPNAAYGCSFHYCRYPINMAADGQIVEDGCAFVACSASSHVAAGAHSSAASRTAFSLHDERLHGAPLRPCFEPTASSPLLGAGAYGSPPATDLWARGRPEGGGSAGASIGPIERHDTGAKDATHQDSGSAACMALAGPSSQDRPILVDAQAVTISVKVRWDGNHGDAAKPRAMLLANPEIGVAGQTATATSTGGSGSTPNAYETLTFAPITPTAAGVVMLRMVSRSASGSGVAYFDTITLS